MREPVAVAAPMVAAAPTPLPPNPFERRLSFDRSLPSVVEAPVLPARVARSGVSWGWIAGVGALILVLVAAVLMVGNRSSGPSKPAEAVADASLPMGTDAEVKAALADVATAQAGHFKAHNAYTSVPKELRVAAAKAPLRTGMNADAPGVVYVDVPAVRSGDEPSFFLVARKPAGDGCLYLKGVPDGTSEASDAGCASGFAVDYGDSPQTKWAKATVLTAADLGAGWTALADDVGAAAGGEQPLGYDQQETAACLGATGDLPRGTAASGFTAKTSVLLSFAAVVDTEPAARAQAAQIDNPRLGTCMADALRRGLFGSFTPGLARARLTVSDRGALRPDRSDVRRARLRIDLVGEDGSGAAIWMDLVLASKGRTTTMLLVLSAAGAPDDARTLQWVDAMGARAH